MVINQTYFANKLVLIWLHLVEIRVILERKKIMFQWMLNSSFDVTDKGLISKILNSIYLFIWLRRVLVAAHWMFVAAHRLLSSCGAWAPECVGSVVCSTRAL